MIREELKLTRSLLKEERLMSVWRSLDNDASGFISAGEFGRFMRLGEKPKGPTWKEKLHLKKAAEGEAVTRDMDKRVGRDLNAKFADVETASAEEVQALSEELNAKMIIFPDPQTRDWFKLFRHMDDDDSGRIAYKELAGMVREELLMSTTAVPEVRLQASAPHARAPRAARRVRRLPHRCVCRPASPPAARRPCRAGRVEGAGRRPVWLHLGGRVRAVDEGGRAREP